MSNQRKSVLINRRFQMTFIFFLGVVIILALFIQLTALHLFVSDLKEYGSITGLPQGHIYYEYIEKQTNNLYNLFWVNFLLFAVVTFLLGMIFSHRIAGPLYRLVTYLEQNSNDPSKVPELSFRNGDFFMEIPESFNKFIKSKDLSN